MRSLHDNNIYSARALHVCRSAPSAVNHSQLIHSNGHTQTTALPGRTFLARVHQANTQSKRLAHETNFAMA